MARALDGQRLSHDVIPIRNLYHLFCYAWSRFEEARTIGVDAEASPNFPNLLAKVLVVGTRSLLRQGLDRAYVSSREELRTVRGHIELGPTLRLHARKVRRIDCSFDDLSHDVLHNQLLKASLKALLGTSTLDRSIARDVHALWLRMPGISELKLTRAAFSRVQLNRNNARYDLLLKICALLFDSMLPLQREGSYAFRDIVRDERKMAYVFQHFVKEFYRLRQRSYCVRPLHLEWQATRQGGSDSIRLPKMETDVYLEGSARRMIIDTKYYVEALQERYGTVSYRSEHLYQLFAYVRNDAAARPEAIVVDGMLLYPTVHRALDSTFLIHGHRIRVATVDLAQPWERVEDRLLALVAA